MSLSIGEAMSRSVSMGYLSILKANQEMIIAELYTITLQNGAVDRFTDFDMDLTVNGHLYKSGSLRIAGLKMKLSVGLNVDEQDIKITALPTDTLTGALFLQGCAQGLLDGATVQRDRAVWAAGGGTTGGGAPYLDVVNASPITVYRMAYGLVSEILKIGRTTVELKVKSPLKLLDINLPRRTYQGSCNWALFEPGCTLNKSSFGVNGTVDTGVLANFVPWVGGVPMTPGADGQPYFALGRLLFTSGTLNNTQFYIANNDSATLFTMGMYTPPAVGDSFTAYPGCAKTFNTCHLKFNNSDNFGGFEFVPPVTLSV